MPRIPVYESGQVPAAGPVSGRRAVAEDFGGGAFASDIGATLGQYADVLANREDQREVSDLNARMAQASADWSIKLDEAVNSAQPGDTMLAERFLEQFDTFASGVEAGTRSGQRYLSGAVADLRAQLQVQVVGGQAKLVGLKARQDYESAVSISANGLIANPLGFDAAMRRQEMALSVAVESGTISPVVAEALGRASASTMGASAVQGFIRQDPRAALAGLNAGEWDQWISPDQKLALTSHAEVEIRRLETEARQRQAEERAKYMTDFDDTVAFLRSGGSLPTNQYSRGRLVSVFGADDGGDLADKVEGAAAFGNVVRSVQSATPEEIAAMLQAEQADLASPDNYRNEAAEVSTLRGVVADRFKALFDDPAGYVQSSSPTVQSAYAAMSEVMVDPLAAPDVRRAATRSYAVASLAEQERLGVPIEDQRLLTPAHAGAISRQFKFQPEGGENAAALIRGLDADWGQYFPQMMGELSGEIPAGALVIAAMPLDSAAAETLAEAINIGAPELAKNHSSEAVKDMKEAVVGALDEFNVSLQALPGAGTRTYGAFREGTELLALMYMSQGHSPVDAAEKAARDTVMGNYVFVDTYRVPVALDAARIERGAVAALGTLDLSNVDVDIPVSGVGLNDSQTAAAYQAAVKSEGFWVTASGDVGLVLHIMNRGVSQAVTIGRRPVTFTWQELLDVLNRPKPQTPIPAFQGE